jgi:anti-sigma regulatory factor (Ser/Thr protein kinase)
MTELAETVVHRPTGSAREARKFIAATLSRWGLDHLSRSTVLVGHELVANALRHGGPPASLRLSRGEDSVVIEVVDRGGGVPQVAEIDNNTSPSGRGLRIVTVLARAWGVRTHEEGKTVWAEIPVQPFTPLEG